MESPEVMQAFLRWLGEDEASGARKYEEIRRKLILLFRYRGCRIPEDLADDTIDRTAHAVVNPDFHYQGDRTAYFRGVARNVYLEWLRKERRLPTEPISEIKIDLPAPRGRSASDDLLQDCLERCMNALPSQKKMMLIRYYQSDKKAKIDDRQLLAEELGIGLNALRIQVFRLRNALRRCVEKCTSKDEISWAEET
jgi:DNA-directed RNA polymerase specialized sigma24 family protein